MLPSISLLQRRCWSRQINRRLPMACASLLVVASVALGASSSPTKRNLDSGATERQAVRVITTREGEVTHFHVENDEWSEITMTLDMSVLNLKGTATFPYTATFAGKTTTEAFSLAPVNSGEKWEYSFTNYYKLGSHCARHTDGYLYQLPYSPGSAFRVTQGYGGSFSHKGSNRYAIDWKMPEGTCVYAARGGLVVKVKDDSNKGGSSMKYDRYNNYVLIRHEDGTLAHYCHLQRDSAEVKPGETVKAGDLIARSGNTGFSSGPHLHFCVFKTRDGRERESIPVSFRTVEKKAISLLEGRTYTATATETAETVTTSTRSVGAGAAQ